MKKEMVILGILVMAIFIVAGCARVNFGLKDGEIIFDRAGGYASPERGLDILEQQARAQTYVLLQKKLQEAIKNDNKKDIKECLELKKEITQGDVSLTRHVSVGIKNNSSYLFEITSGEFKNLTLKPKETSSFSKIIPIGTYTFYLKFIDDAGKIREWDVSRIITKSTKYIVIKNVRR